MINELILQSPGPDQPASHKSGAIPVQVGDVIGAQPVPHRGNFSIPRRL